MSATPIQGILESIYQSLQNNNENLDQYISQLKNILLANGETTVSVDSSRLVQANRQGRKLMQAYFRQRGVIIQFS